MNQWGKLRERHWTCHCQSTCTPSKPMRLPAGTYPLLIATPATGGEPLEQSVSNRPTRGVELLLRPVEDVGHHGILPLPTLNLLRPCCTAAALQGGGVLQYPCPHGSHPCGHVAVPCRSLLQFQLLKGGNQVLPPDHPVRSSWKARAGK